jgi:hypothetical protein
MTILSLRLLGGYPENMGSKIAFRGDGARALERAK